MARFEERDPRWIVEEREDGVNVKNWHWTEKDCTAWSKARLSELLSGAELTDDTAAVPVQVSGLNSLTGEAFINNRKNKIFASFDLNLKIKYHGSIRDGEEGIGGGAEGDGVIEVPNLSDEQEPEDWEFRVVPFRENSVGHRVKEEILSRGQAKLRALLSTYVHELKAGVPVNKQDEQLSKEAAVQLQTSVKKGKQKPSPVAVQGFHELRLVERYHANPQDIFDCFVIPGKLQAFTQSPAKVEATVGGAFSWFDGAVSGNFLEIRPPTNLVLNWRFSHWPEGHFSQVTLQLENPESGLTVLSLHQTKIPEEDNFGHGNVLSVTETGWNERILTRIKAVFGYGI